MKNKVLMKTKRIFAFIFLQLYRIQFYKIISDISIKGKFRQPVLCNGKGDICIHPSVVFGVVYSKGFYSGYTYIESRTESSNIKVGKNTNFNNNLTIISNGAGINIGEKCLIGTDVEIVDSDFHELDYNLRGSNNSLNEPVHIADNVFIGNSVKILKGVSIGEGAVIAAGSVVTSDIARKSIAAGIPAKIVKQL